MTDIRVGGLAGSVLRRTNPPTVQIGGLAASALRRTPAPRVNVGGAAVSAMRARSTPATMAYENANPGTAAIFIGKAATEQVVSGMRFDGAKAGTTARVVVDLWISMLLAGPTKAGIARLRVGGVGGAVIASQAFGDAGDSGAGHQGQFYFDGNVAIPAAGSRDVVVTIQTNNANNPDFYSDTRAMRVYADTQPGWVAPDPVIYQNPTPTGIVNLGTAAAEKVVTGMTYAGSQPDQPLRVYGEAWFSMVQSGATKSGIARLRLGGVTGAVLASQVLSDAGDSTAGHQGRFAFDVTTSAIIAQGTEVVVTIQTNNANNPTFYSDTRTFVARGMVTPGVPGARGYGRATATAAQVALYNNPDATGVVNLGQRPSEAAVTGMTYAQTKAGTTARVVVDLWFSMSLSGSSKAAVARLRVGGVTGTIVASQTYGDPGSDSTAGHLQRFTFDGNVAIPAAGSRDVVVTLTTNNGNNPTFYSDTRTFTLYGTHESAANPNSATGKATGVGTASATAQIRQTASAPASGSGVATATAAAVVPALTASAPAAGSSGATAAATPRTRGVAAGAGSATATIDVRGRSSGASAATASAIPAAGAAAAGQASATAIAEEFVPTSTVHLAGDGVTLIDTPGPGTRAVTVRPKPPVKPTPRTLWLDTTGS